MARWFLQTRSRNVSCWNVHSIRQQDVAFLNTQISLVLTITPDATLEESLTLELDLKEDHFGCNTLFGPQIRRECFGRAARQHFLREHSLAAAAP